MEKLKLVLRKVLIVLLVLWMIAVFVLSHQTGEDSGNLSRKVALFFSNGNVEEAESLEPVVRKVAHMTEYAAGGMIFYGILCTYPNNSRKKKSILAFAFVVLYAGSDELHQSFINARNGNVIDVCIDTFGGVLGILSVFIIETAIRTMDARIQEDLKNPKIEG